MPCRLGTAVYRKMFWRGQRLQIFRVISLQASHVSNAHLRCQERVFAIGFLAASPTRISEDVDVRRPDGQPVKPVAITLFPHPLGIFGPELGGNNIRFFVEQVRIESCSQSDCLRKNGRIAFARGAVQTFAPPVVLRNSQPSDCGRRVHHLRDFLVQRQARN